MNQQLDPGMALPWITARVLAATEFCPRAGVIAFEDSNDDSGDEDETGPRLDYLPDFSVIEIETSLQSTLNAIWRALTWTPPIVLAVSIVSYLKDWRLSLVLLPAALVGGYWLFRRLRDVAELSQRLRAASDAAVAEPLAESTETQPVNWWSLLKAGYSSVEYEDAHENPALRFSGRPWRVLHKGSLRIPVFRKRCGKPELSRQHFARMAAYCQLIEDSEGGHSPYGIVLFGSGYDGLTVPCTPANIGLFQRVLARTRDLVQSSVATAAFPDKPSSISCRDCPLGAARVYRAGRRDTWLGKKQLPPLLTRGTDRRLYHSICGDRFQWVPPHATAKEKGLC